MNYLSPEIAKHAKNASRKSLVKPSVSCGIFQDCFDTDSKYNKKFIELSKKIKRK